MLVIGGFSIQFHGFGVFLPFTITEPPTHPGPELKSSAAPEILQAVGDIFSTTRYPDYKGGKVGGSSYVRIRRTLIGVDSKVSSQIADLGLEHSVDFERL